MDSTDQSPQVAGRSPWLLLGGLTVGVNLLLLGGVLGVLLFGRADRDGPARQEQQREALDLVAQQRLLIAQQQRLLAEGQDREQRALAALEGADRRITALKRQVEALSRQTEALRKQLKK